MKLKLLTCVVIITTITLLLYKFDINQLLSPPKSTFISHPHPSQNIAVEQKKQKNLPKSVVSSQAKNIFETLTQSSQHQLVNKVKQSVGHSKVQTREANLKKKPHILFIVADDLGYNDVGYHGSGIKTPYLDNLAKSGVRLENYYVQRVCTPTRGQLLSGRYEIHTGLHSILKAQVPYGLTLDSPTIADKLKEAGYSTHMVGKWHVGFYKKEYLPTSRGFDTFFGIPTGYADYFNYHYGGSSMTGTALIENDRPADMSKYSGNYSTHLYAEKIKDTIRNHKSNKPLFLLLSYQTPHTPLQVPESYLSQYKNYRKIQRAKLAGMTTCMDETIGDIVQTMKDKGIWNDTVLVFTSDNGGDTNKGSSNYPLRGKKGNLWEGGIRAVGFVHSNLLNGNTSGTVSKELMHVTDWFPTLVNLAGGNLKGTKPLDGFDQWDTITNGMESPRKEILHHINSDAPLNKQVSKAAIRIGDWKLLTGFGGSHLEAYPNRSIFLANIKNDPSERKDLAAEMPEMVATMLARIEYYRKGMVYQRWPDHDPQANPNLHGGFWLPWR